MLTYEKYEDERLPYDWNFAPRLRSGDSVAAILEVEIIPADGVLLVEAPVLATPLVQAYFSAGMPGQLYACYCDVRTALGETLVARGGLLVKPDDA
jgi:hypothetical protein